MVSTSIYYFLSSVAQSVAALIGLFSIFAIYAKNQKEVKNKSRIIPFISRLKKLPKDVERDSIINYYEDLVDIEDYDKINHHIHYILTKSIDIDTADAANNYTRVSKLLNIDLSQKSFFAKNAYVILAGISFVTIFICLLTLPFVEYIINTQTWKYIFLGVVLILLSTSFCIFFLLLIKGIKK